MSTAPPVHLRTVRSFWIAMTAEAALIELQARSRARAVRAALEDFLR